MLNAIVSTLIGFLKPFSYIAPLSCFMCNLAGIIAASMNTVSTMSTYMSKYLGKRAMKAIAHVTVMLLSTS